MTPTRRRYSTWLLAGLLVLAQAVLAEHEVHHLDHDDHPAACGYCLVGSDLKHAAGQRAVLSLATFHHVLKAGPVRPCGPAPCTPSGVARGPPA